MNKHLLVVYYIRHMGVNNGRAEGVLKELIDAFECHCGPVTRLRAHNDIQMRLVSS